MTAAAALNLAVMLRNFLHLQLLKVGQRTNGQTHAESCTLTYGTPKNKYSIMIFYRFLPQMLIINPSVLLECYAKMLFGRFDRPVYEVILLYLSCDVLDVLRRLYRSGWASGIWLLLYALI